MPEITAITRSFTATYWSILLAKLRNFVKRSLIKYALASVLLTWGLRSVNAQPPLVSGSALRTWVIIALVCIGLGLSAMLLSTPFLQRAWRARPITVTFQEDGLTVRMGDSSEPQATGWDWVVSADQTRSHYFLSTKDVRKFYLILSRKKLTTEEDEALHAWLVGHGKFGR